MMSGGFWSIEAVRDYDELWQDASAESDGKARVTWIPTRETADGKTERLNDLTAILIFLLPAIEIDEITDANVEEVFTRLRMLEVATGGMLKGDDGKSQMLSLRHVHRHIGMRVGAGMAVSPFAERLIGFLRTQAADALKSEKENN